MQVPVVTRQIQQQGLPGVQQTNSGVANYQAPTVSADNFLSNDAQVLIKSSSAAAHEVSNAASQMYAQQLFEANQTRFKDGYTQYQKAVQDRMYGENGALNQRGINAFQQPNGQSLVDNVGDDLMQARSQIAESLSNDQQRQWFNAHADALDLHVRGQLMGYEAEQHRVYQRSILEASDAVESDNISLTYNDPNTIKKSLDTLYQNGLSRAQLEGLPEEIGKQLAKKNTSNALTQAINSALAQNDHASATRILHDFAPDMDQNDMLKMANTITTANDKRQALNIGQSVVSELYPRMQTSEGDRALNILFNAESGGNHFIPGTKNPVTSSKGAVGVAQIMPDTGPEAAKLAGLDWDENRFRNDPEYNKALGTAYFNQQLKSFKGNLGMAYAAYNAGPAATQDAIEKALKQGGDWLAYLPPETQAYVNKNMNAYAAGEGQYQSATLADAIQLADSKTVARYGENATQERIKMARDEATFQFKLQEDAIKQRGDEATNSAYKALEQNGGNINAVDLSRVPGDKRPSLHSFAEKVRNKDDQQNPQAWAHVMTLSPSELAKMTPDSFYAEYRGQLDNSHMDKGMELVKAAQNNGGDQAHLEVVTTTERIKRAAQKAGILPWKGDPDEEQSQRFANFESAVDDRLREFETAQGGKRKANSDELQKILDETNMDLVFWDSSGLDTQAPVGSLTDAERNTAYVRTQNINAPSVRSGRGDRKERETKITDVPFAWRNEIVSRLADAGHPVTEQAIVENWIKAGSPK